MINQAILLFIISLFTLSATDIAAQETGLVKWEVEKNSRLYIKGSTNVNRFSCDINVESEKDTIQFNGDGRGSVRLHGSIKMDIINFDCKNGMITKGLRKTLNAEKYPKMVIQFISLGSVPLFTLTSEHIKGWVEVELAGVKKLFELEYTFTKGEPGNIKLNGGRNFCFSDFKLMPPKKLGGMIKIRDEFNVNFELIFRPLTRSNLIGKN